MKEERGRIQARDRSPRTEEKSVDKKDQPAEKNTFVRKKKGKDPREQKEKKKNYKTALNSNRKGGRGPERII